MSWITIAVGGALGALSRFGIGLLVSASGYAHIHLATLGVNVIGSLLIGFMFIAAERLQFPDPLRLGLSVGFFGAFTTFSAFSLEVITDIQQGLTLRAVLYVTLSLLLCLAACAVGVEYARSYFD